MKTLYSIFIFYAACFTSFAQNSDKQAAYDLIPIVYSNIVPDSTGDLYFEGGKLIERESFYTLDNIRINPAGTENGLLFDFNNKDFQGTIYYGLFAKELPKHPQTVFFSRSSKIKDGIAEIKISELTGRYDIAGWEDTGRSRLGYRIVNSSGRIIYDGRININGKGPFETGLSIIEGPLVNMVSESEATISFKTNQLCSPFITANEKEFWGEYVMANPVGDINHEIRIHHLEPETDYEYVVHYGDFMEKHSFKTAPKNGSRKPFVFAYTSDSRAGSGGGERAIYGTNAYIMKKMAALATYNNADFFQFTGDMINGYSTSIGETNLQYVNWKRNLEPFWHSMPFNVGMGNHEVVVAMFNDGSRYGVQIDKFPFDTKSAERIFADNFTNPKNGPKSEDGSKYDPKPKRINFPSYQENVFYYTYDNIAMIVLNSNYLYTSSAYDIPKIGGNAHGYVMDNQLEWLENTLMMFNEDESIDHVFVTIHTPAFPNGGHSKDDMWYGGNNNIRPVIAGKAVEKGIIERRDDILHLLINKSDKVLALLCGDEHNYSRLKLTKKTPIYPDNYIGKKLKVKRPFWHITNGSAGAPYYGQEKLPWSESVEMFSTQYALMLFFVEGKTVTMKVINPDTLEDIEEVLLTQ